MLTNYDYLLKCDFGIRGGNTGGCTLQEGQISRHTDLHFIPVVHETDETNSLTEILGRC